MYNSWYHAIKSLENVQYIIISSVWPCSYPANKQMLLKTINLFGEGNKMVIRTFVYIDINSQNKCLIQKNP